MPKPFDERRDWYTRGQYGYDTAPDASESDDDEDEEETDDADDGCTCNGIGGRACCPFHGDPT